MDEKPVEALRKKRDNSISKCWGLMAGGDVKAVVSAGNTGAMVASALFNAKMFLPGVRRPGIAAIFPSHQGPIVIIDVGANMNAKAEDLYQYGVMGAIYAETILGVTEPQDRPAERRDRGGEGDRPDQGHPRPLPEEPAGRSGSSATSRAATSTRGTPASSSARGSSATSC